VSQEEDAAIIYDILYIQNKCLDANINYNINRSSILSILFEKSLIQVKLELDQNLKRKRKESCEVEYSEPINYLHR
jgi:hypothetical protein